MEIYHRSLAISLGFRQAISQDSYPHEFGHYLSSTVCMLLFNLSQNGLNKEISIEKQTLRNTKLIPH